MHPQAKVEPNNNENPNAPFISQFFQTKFIHKFADELLILQKQLQSSLKRKQKQMVQSNFINTSTIENLLYLSRQVESQLYENEEMLVKLQNEGKKEGRFKIVEIPVEVLMLSHSSNPDSLEMSESRDDEKNNKFWMKKEDCRLKECEIVETSQKQEWKEVNETMGKIKTLMETLGKQGASCDLRQSQIQNKSENSEEELLKSYCIHDHYLYDLQLIKQNGQGEEEMTVHQNKQKFQYNFNRIVNPYPHVSQTEVNISQLNELNEQLAIIHEEKSQLSQYLRSSVSEIQSLKDEIRELKAVIQAQDRLIDQQQQHQIENRRLLEELALKGQSVYELINEKQEMQTEITRLRKRVYREEEQLKQNEKREEETILKFQDEILFQRQQIDEKNEEINKLTEANEDLKLQLQEIWEQFKCQLQQHKESKNTFEKIIQQKDNKIKQIGEENDQIKKIIGGQELKNYMNKLLFEKDSLIQNMRIQLQILNRKFIQKEQQLQNQKKENKQKQLKKTAKNQEEEKAIREAKEMKEYYEAQLHQLRKKIIQFHEYEQNWSIEKLMLNYEAILMDYITEGERLRQEVYIREVKLKEKNQEIEELQSRLECCLKVSSQTNNLNTKLRKQVLVYEQEKLILDLIQLNQ